MLSSIAYPILINRICCRDQTHTDDSWHLDTALTVGRKIIFLSGTLWRCTVFSPFSVYGTLKTSTSAAKFNSHTLSNARIFSLNSITLNRLLGLLKLPSVSKQELPQMKKKTNQNTPNTHTVLLEIENTFF